VATTEARERQLRGKVAATVEHWQYLYCAVVGSVDAARKRAARRYLAILRNARKHGLAWREFKARAL
jgi:hypothetical protein